MRKIDLANVKLDICNLSEVQAYFNKCADSDICHSIMFLNLFAFTLAQTDEAFKEAINSSDIVINDGLGVDLLVNRAGYNTHENLNGTDLIPKMIDWANALDQKVFLLGAKQENVVAAYSNINSQYGGQVVSDYNNGYFSDSENEYIIKKINESGASLLILGLGMPYQEKWIFENKDKLANVRIAVAGGAIIDYMSGLVKRSPEFWVKLRLEWLYRMLREPGRMIKRNVHSAFVLLKFYFKVGNKK